MATLTETWEPANHLEQRLRDALRTGDQDAYFAALSAGELFIPLSQGEPGGPPPPFTWPTSTHEGRTQVVAYTSAEAGRACLGPAYEHFARMPFPDVARSWPNPECWLAVNAGLPIEGYLPAWFITQLCADAEAAGRAADAGRPAQDRDASVGGATAVRQHLAAYGAAVPEAPSGPGSAPLFPPREPAPSDALPPLPAAPDAVPPPLAPSGVQSPLPAPLGAGPAEPAPSGAAPPAPARHAAPPSGVAAFPAGAPARGDVPASPYGESPSMPPYGESPSMPPYGDGRPSHGQPPLPDGRPSLSPAEPAMPAAAPIPSVVPAPSPTPVAAPAPPPVSAPASDLTSAAASDAAPVPGAAPPPAHSDRPVPPQDAAPQGIPPVAATMPQPAVSDLGPLAAAPAYGPPAPGEPSLARNGPPSDDPAAAPARGPAEVAPIALHVVAGVEFAPLDDEERELHEAAVRGDTGEFLRILLGVRQIWVPMTEAGDLVLGPGRPGFQWSTRGDDGRATIPLFTGPSRMREALGEHPFVLSDLAKVLRFWPDPGHDLVINAGSPIGATIGGAQITDLSRRVDAEAAARLARDFPAQNDAERLLFDARDDPDLMVKALLDASVFLPVWSRTPPTVQASPTDPTFPWSALPVRGRVAVTVFTSFDWMKEAVGTTGFVMPAFADLLVSWPNADWSVSVNPGTPIEIALPGEQIRTLGRLIADRPAATVPPAAVAPTTAEGIAPPAFGAVAPPPAGLDEPDGLDGLDGPGGPEAPPPAVPEPTDARQERADGHDDAGQAPDIAAEADLLTSSAAEWAEAPPTSGAWTVMQKVIPHEQVSWYRDKAYDRVAGFVHRVRDVVDLGTPAQLYEALGLLPEGSPFALGDPQVHVIRWPAYLPALYRVPFGGDADETATAWGEHGRVVEAPPFAGDGFAPGSGGTIPEYKVDSVRLPHGAEMYVIHSDGSERFIARYDADRLIWGDIE